MQDIQKLLKLHAACSGVVIDSRKVIKGSLFFALKGERSDGNAFAKQALADGALAAVVDNPALKEEEGCVWVDDVLLALQSLAKAYRQTLDIPVIALTGSNGKTTTKELLHAVLRKKFRTSATLGNLNNHIGVPLTLLDIPADTEIAIVEMGANHQGEIRDLCQIAQPTHGLITNIGKAHLEGFGGLEGVLKGKSELYQDIMSRNGIVFIHSANTELTNLISDYRQVYSYGSKDSDQFIGRSASKGGFAAVEVDGNYFTSQLVGVYNESNILAALAIGSYFHITLEEMTDAITSYTPENNRSQWLPHGKNHYVMDAYNANPSSMQEAIRNFAAMEVHPKTLILGDMLELGTRALEEHKALIRQAGQAGADQVITVGPLFGEADTDHDTMHFLDTDALITYLSKKDFSGMYFLVKGSRRIGLERILV